MPCLTKSAAIDFVRPMIAALVVPYTNRFGAPLGAPTTEETLMMEPGLPVSTRRRDTACDTKKAARTLSDSTKSKSSTLTSTNGAGRLVPALLTRMSNGSCAAIAARTVSTSRTSSVIAAAGCPLSSDDQLSRPPRGFEAAKGTPVEEYVGWKSFTTHAALSDAEMQSAELVGRIVDFARLMLPLLNWGWAAVDDEAPAPLPIRAFARRPPQPDF